MSKFSKKILVVTGPFFGKSWGAGQQDTYGLIKLLIEADHKVDLVSYDRGTNPGQVERFKQSGAKVSVFPIGSGFSLWPDMATHPFFKLCASRDFIKFFEDINPDIVLGVQTFTFPVLEFAKKRGKIAILRSHNLEHRHHLAMFRGWQLFNPITVSLYLFKYLSEIFASKRSSFVWAISPRELSVYKKWNSESKLLPLCALHEKLKDPTERLNEVHKKINIFYAGGTYNILPHLKGAELLIEKIMSVLQRKEPNLFVLHVIGSKLPQGLIDKCDGRNIIYKGYVNDYDATLEEMDIGVFPTFTGEGMKQKIFEAVCRGFPVVVPRKALGGYPLEHGKNILIANSTDEFAENILKLKNGKFRQKISHGAYEFAKENFNKSKYTDILCREIN